MAVLMNMLVVMLMLMLMLVLMIVMVMLMLVLMIVMVVLMLMVMIVMVVVLMLIIIMMMVMALSLEMIMTPFFFPMYSDAQMRPGNALLYGRLCGNLQPGDAHSIQCGKDFIPLRDQFKQCCSKHVPRCAHIAFYV